MTFGDHVHDTVVAKEAERTRRRAEEAEEKVARYERFLRAFAADDGGKLFDGVSMIDAQEWLAETARDLLDGNEACCPICSTHMHEGACVGEEDETAAPAKCRVCGCTDLDCRQCIERTGHACHWVEADLCSACVEPKTKMLAELINAR